jgi:hypothetical protein
MGMEYVLGGRNSIFIDVSNKCQSYKDDQGEM